MQVGKWLDMKGYAAGGSRQRTIVREKRARPLAAAGSDGFGGGAAAALALAPAPKVAKLDPDEPDPWKRMVEGDFAPVRVKWSGDRCAVCSSEVDYDTDQLIHCHGCGIAVHQSCYGVRRLPRPEDKWVCRACERVQEGHPRPRCAVCPVDGGALKVTTLPGVWCHVTCMQARPSRALSATCAAAHFLALPIAQQSCVRALLCLCVRAVRGAFEQSITCIQPSRAPQPLQWVPELGVVDTDTMEPIQGVDAILRDRWALNCTVCRQRVGAKVQCSKCYTAFHPLCGRLRGFTMDMLENPRGPQLPLVTVLHCHKHCTPKPGTFGVTLKCAPPKMATLLHVPLLRHETQKSAESACL
jgi:PHD-like zinc-binding domain/PHD-finger